MQCLRNLRSLKKKYIQKEKNKIPKKYEKNIKKKKRQKQKQK
jgi:hypothetical protein